METQETPVLMVILALILTGAVIVYIAMAAGQRSGPQSRVRGWNAWRTLSFLIGVLLLAAAWLPPLAHAAHHDLRGHMLQHLLVGMFAPLALALGAADLLALRTLPVQVSRRITALLRGRALRLLAPPATALVLNTGGMYLLYLTPLYAASLEDGFVHALVQVHFLLAGCLFTWSILGAGPLARPHGLLTRLAVLFLAAAGHAVLGKLMYAYGLPEAEIYGLDQVRAAAQLMYYGGDLAELLLAVALFAGWYAGSGRSLFPDDRLSTGRPAVDAHSQGYKD